MTFNSDYMPHQILFYSRLSILFESLDDLPIISLNGLCLLSQMCMTPLNTEDVCIHLYFILFIFFYH